MDKARQKVRTFLQSNSMDCDDIDMEQCCGIFLADMESGLAGRKSSLAMLATYIEIGGEIPSDKPVIVMDAGGTNFRVATVRITHDGTSVIENTKRYTMPGIDKQVSKKDFFNTMAGYMEPVADASRQVGFCFSYPIEIFPNKDGKVLYFSKEIKAPEVEGQMIGENLNLAIEAAGAERKQMVLLNDTVATLLAGRAESIGRTYDSFIGFILGTGTNTSYVEANSNITKAKGLDPSRSQIINIESGGFGKAPRGTVDEQFDAASVSPGVNTFEKMISGAYLGPLCLATVKAAAQAGLFAKDTADRLGAIAELQTKDVSDFLTSPDDSRDSLSTAARSAGQEDIATLRVLVDRLVERAAKLTAINLSSAVLKSGKGQNPSRPVCIVAEGTTFYKLANLKARVEAYLNRYLVEQKNRHYEIINVDNATLIGAAIAGLTN